LTSKEYKKGGIHYGQQFGPNHKCPDLKLRVAILGEGKTWNGEGETVVEC